MKEGTKCLQVSNNNCSSHWFAILVAYQDAALNHVFTPPTLTVRRCNNGNFC